jgi:hypothetical protein
VNRVIGAVIVALGLSVGIQAEWQVRMEIGLPNGAAKPQLVMREGRMATIRLDNASFGFEAAIDTTNPEAIRVTVYELNGQERSKVEELVVPAGGGAVSTRTTPSFALSVVSVTDVR